MSDNIYITFDIDWAPDYILEHCIEFCGELDMRVTYFATHQTKLLDQINCSNDNELAVHPNFDNLLNRKEGQKGVEIILKELRDFAPSARSIRSHSVLQSARLLDIFAASGFTHDVNTWIPHWSGIQLGPWKDHNGIVMVPFYWADDIYCVNQQSRNVRGLLDRPGLKVLDFHPVHLYLNTDSYELYESSKPYHNEPKALERYRNNSTKNGVRVFLEELIIEAKRKDLGMGLISEISVSS